MNKSQPSFYRAKPIFIKKIGEKWKKHHYRQKRIPGKKSFSSHMCRRRGMIEKSNQSPPLKRVQK